MNLPVHPLAGQRVGYARISSASQNLDGQPDALNAAGCEKIFADTASGKLTERPELGLCLGYLRAGDTLVETVNALADRGVAFASLHEGIDTTTSTGHLVFHIFAALAEFERELIAERAAGPPNSPRSKPGWPGPGTKPRTSPWPRSPGRWASAAAPSTGRSSRRPDIQAARGLRSVNGTASGISE
jgi:hypothetical protein